MNEDASVDKLMNQKHAMLWQQRLYKLPPTFLYIVRAVGELGRSPKKAGQTDFLKSPTLCQ